MRWRLGRDRGACTTCGTCGAELDPDAVWCGSCGAAVAGAAEAEQAVVEPAEQPAERADGPPEPPYDPGGAAGPRWRPLARAVAIVAVVGLVVALLRPDPPPEPLLGRVDALTGVSATGPPPDGLRLAWRSDLPPGGVTGEFRGGDVVAADGLVRVDDVVVDVAGGRVVRRGAQDAGGTREWVQHLGGELVVVDTLTGEVTSRVPLEAPSGARLVAQARSGAVTLLAGGDRSLLVRDDGSVLAELEGTIADADRAVSAPAAFPIRVADGQGSEGSEGSEGREVQLVSAATGETVRAFSAPAGGMLAVDVVGDLALVATTSQELPGPVTGVPWMVAIIDARTAERLDGLVTQSAEPPRLLGVLDNGTIVVSSRSGREVAVRGIAPDGRQGLIAQVPTGVPEVLDGPSATTSALLATVGVSGGVAVALDDRRGLLGLSRRGNALWQVDVPDAEVLAVGDGYAAAFPGAQGRVLVVDATEGTVAAAISRGAAGLRVVNVPFAVLDGHVGMSRRAGVRDPRVQLGATTWFDLHTGVLTPVHDLFAPFGDGQPRTVGGDWLLQGVDGRGAPVITRRRSPSVVQVLDPGGEFVTFDLPGQTDDGAVAAYVAEPVGASSTRVAVLTRDLEDPTEVATHVLDRASGAVVTVPGVAGGALVGELLVAVEVDEQYEVTALVGIDAGDGERRWTRDAGDGAGGSPWRNLLQTSNPSRLDRELLVAAAPLVVEAISLRDGGPRWSHASDTELSGDHLVLGPRHVVVAATDGEVIALDRDDGTVAWRTALGVPVAAMTGAGGHVLVGTDDGLVVHLDADGREVQRIAVGSSPVLGLAALGETVVAVAGDAVVGLRADGTGITRQDEVELP